MKGYNWEHYLTRPFTLFGASLWQEWYSIPLTEKILGVRMNDSLFIEQTPGIVRNYRISEQLNALKKVTKTISEDEDRVEVLFKEAERLNELAKKYISGENKFSELTQAVDFLTNMALHATIIPFWVGLYAKDLDYKNKKLVTKAEELRSVSYYPDFVNKVVNPLAEEYLDGLGVDKILLAYITYKEILNIKSVDTEARKREALGGRFYVYQIVDGIESVSFTNNTADVIREIEHIEIPKEIKGQIAYKGIVRGVARLILSSKDKKEFNEGDVLVTINSNPSLMSFIQKSGAMVTDEGGVTCHAAIVSRELKIPCIIGTKIATQVLKDGDLVEVDASAGVVKILEKAP